MKKVLYLLLTFILVFSLIGCKKDTDLVDTVGENKNIPQKIEDIPKLEHIDPSELESVISEEETPFTLVKDGKEVYLDENSPDVIRLMMAVAEYGEKSETIDYKTTDGRGYYNILTEEGKKSYDEANMSEESIKHYNEYKIVKHSMGIEKYNFIKLEEDTAIVGVDIAFLYENVENLANYVTGKTYYKPKTLEFKLIDGKWLLNKDLETGGIYHYGED